MREFFDLALGAGFRALLFGIGNLPPPLARGLCAAAASLYARVGGERIVIARINLKLAFPDYSEQVRDRILIESFANLGRSVAEVCLMHESKSGDLFNLVSIEGRKNLDLAKERSGQPGALIVTAHFGSWEFCAAALSHHGLPVSAVQHGFSNPHIEKIITSWRQRAGLETISMGGASLGLFRALARGRYVALLMDQNASEEEGVLAAFFSHPAMTRSGPALIAMTRGTAVLPVFFFRVGKTGAHVARIGTPLQMERAAEESQAALVRNVERINAAVEDAIRENPEQWIWSHRRFKTLPPGMPSMYPPRRSMLRRMRHMLRRDAGS